MSWNEQKIRDFAADALTFDRARGIFFGNRWLNLQGNEKLIWGEYPAGGTRSSGPTRVYRTAVDPLNERFYCSCSSRIQPCKHTLALMLQLLRRNDSFFVTYDLPEWVEKWTSPAEKSAEKRQISKEEATRRAAQQEKTKDKRLVKMEAGVDELESWLIDLLNQGLASLAVQDADFWDGFAARMVDAKLGGIGKRIRIFKDLQAGENWHELLLHELAELYLFVRAFRRMQYLPPALQEDMLNLAGVPKKQADVLQGKGVRDRWLVAGITEGVEEKLNYRRTWLLGEKTGRFALLLDYSWGNQGYDTHWNRGNVLEGECVYYPSAYPQRALIRDFKLSKAPFMNQHAYPTLDDFGDAYAKALAANPWVRVMPLFLEECVPVFHEKQFYLIDQSARQLTLNCEPAVGWKMVALSGGRPISVFGEWNGQLFQPLAVLTEEKLVSL